MKLKCDPLTENLTCLHNSVFEINAIEIHWVKNVCYKKVWHVLITPVNREGRHKLRSLIHYWIRLFMESKNIVVSFLYHEANVSFVCLFNMTLSHFLLNGMVVFRPKTIPS